MWRELFSQSSENEKRDDLSYRTYKLGLLEVTRASSDHDDKRDNLED